MGRAQRGVDGRRTGWRRVAKLAVLAAVIVPLTTGCSVQEAIRFGWPEGVTPQADAEVLEAYRTHFGFELARLPGVALQPVGPAARA